MNQLDCYDLAVYEIASAGRGRGWGRGWGPVRGVSHAIVRTMHTCKALCNQSVKHRKSESYAASIMLPAAIPNDDGGWLIFIVATIMSTQ